MKSLSRTGGAIAALALVLASPARAALVDVGPVNTVTSLPDWYQDPSGLALKLCVTQTGYCLLPVPPDPINFGDPTLPNFVEITTTGPVTEENFPDESFYFAAEALLPIQGGAQDWRLGMFLEAAFLSGVAPDTAVVFLRLQVDNIDDLTPNSSYLITHPYGSFTVTTDAAGSTPKASGMAVRLEDGPTDVFHNPPYFAPNIRNAALTKIGPFLRSANGFVTGPDNLIYLADPAVPTEVVGSPFNTNFFRIEGPNIGGPGVNSVETNLFTLAGLVASLLEAPTDVTAEAGIESATVSWTPDEVGDAPTSYVVRTLSSTAGAVIPGDITVTGDPLPTSVVVGNLTPGATYTFRVQGVLGDAASPFSAASNEVVPEQAPTPPPPPPTRVASGDFNGDGKSDILWRNTDTHEIYVYLMDGTTISSGGLISTVTADWRIVAVADFDGGGTDDILWQNSATGEVYLYTMADGAIAGGASVTTVEQGWNVVGAGNFDGDAAGTSDILWRNSDTGLVYIYFMNGPVIASAEPVATVGSEWQVAGTGDFDGDANTTDDILWYNPTIGLSYLYLMNGAVITSALPVASVTTDWQIAAVGTFDDDAKADILWFNRDSGLVYLYTMDGASIATSNPVASVTADWEIAQSGRFDAGNNFDILWRNNVTGEFWTYLMSGHLLAGGGPVAQVDPVWQVVR